MYFQVERHVAANTLHLTNTVLTWEQIGLSKRSVESRWSRWYPDNSPGHLTPDISIGQFPIEQFSIGQSRGIPGVNVSILKVSQGHFNPRDCGFRPIRSRRKRSQANKIAVTDEF